MIIVEPNYSVSYLRSFLTAFLTTLLGPLAEGAALKGLAAASEGWPPAALQ